MCGHIFRFLKKGGERKPHPKEFFTCHFLSFFFHCGKTASHPSRSQKEKNFFKKNLAFLRSGKKKWKGKSKTCPGFPPPLLSFFGGRISHARNACCHIEKKEKRASVCRPPFPFPQLSPLCCFNNSGWDMGRGGGREDRADCVRDAFVFEKRRRRGDACCCYGCTTVWEEFSRSM